MGYIYKNGVTSCTLKPENIEGDGKMPVEP